MKKLPEKIVTLIDDLLQTDRYNLSTEIYANTTDSAKSYCKIFVYIKRPDDVKFKNRFLNVITDYGGLNVPKDLIKTIIVSDEGDIIFHHKTMSLEESIAYYGKGMGEFLYDTYRNIEEIIDNVKNGK